MSVDSLEPRCSITLAAMGLPLEIFPSPMRNILSKGVMAEITEPMGIIDFT